MSTDRLYRVTFLNQGQVYEIYVRNVGQGGMLGFIEIEDIVFGARSSLLVDPSEEKLKNEFAHVKRSYLPIHSVVRVDEVTQEGPARITAWNGESNVMPFPLMPGGSHHRK
jgi:hypothetical protein